MQAIRVAKLVAGMFVLTLLLSVNNYLKAANPDPAKILFADYFEYEARKFDRSAAKIFIDKGGWNNVKTQQSNGSGFGYLYTTNKIPGYTGNFPGRESRSVLAIEALPQNFGGQTDFYLEYGCVECPKDTIPADVWFQFWIYSNHYKSSSNGKRQDSQYSFKNKFLYPCNSNYPCSSHKWLVWIGSANPQSSDLLADGNAYLFLRDSYVGSPRNNLAESGNESKLGQSLTSEHIAANRWTLVKIHIDTSNNRGNRFETWMKPLGGDWVKVSEWIDGKTAGFNWHIPENRVGGHRVLRMPTTFPGGIGRGDQLLNAWIYIDDFVMTNSEQALPRY